jgi:hypothetical protein
LIKLDAGLFVAPFCRRYIDWAYTFRHRGRFEIVATERLFQLDFKPAAGQRKMPTAYHATP